ncbi:hypothetical protein AJ80_06099 [Polytolypa hystricis UAMH7299]|uniref:ABC bile acid transporter n=1 Tax=Polytolypa hystricis (strain UAMH7299) TaxID=1447883 RepID=A0A2B7XQQ6_POLH7|nr:hypothetical protein AJ80_06099 [Polytolypa hystricis UAMH7299]
MVDASTISLSAGAAGLALVALSTLPALRSLSVRLSSRQRSGYEVLHGLYQDEDGEATEESTKAFSDKTQRVLILILSVVGLLASLSLAILTTQSTHELLVDQWLRFPLWVFISLQSVSLFVEPLSTKRFSIAMWIALSNTLLLVVVCAQSGFFTSWSSWPGLKTAHGALTIVQIGVASLSACTATLIPRRPDVFRNGVVVDAQFTTSLLGRISFSWPGPLLAFTIKNRGLDVDDLPELNYNTRAKSLRTFFDEASKKSRTLWKILLYRYRSALLLQLFLTCTSAILSFTPQLALLGILRSLEARGSEKWDPSTAWTWVFLLGGSLFIHSTIEAWLFWIVYSKLGIVVYEELSAVIFAKSMRRKDVKGQQKPAGKKADGSISGSAEHRKDDDDEEDDAQKTRQATINLVAVDSKRIADFAAFNYLIPGTAVTLTTACIFLVRLIGWRSLCAGLLVSVVITPLNIFTARRYTNAQTSLMKYRDQKMAVITEVLQGIRQIKFSALEAQWEGRIAEIRETELQAQWTTFVYDIVLISIWILGPVMLSAVSLGVYSLLHGGLSASVAFTTMSIFSSLEITLAILPELISDFVEAWVSAGRVEKYLNSAERLQNTSPADEISFENATIAWPAEDAEEVQDRFALRELNLNFPSKALSVISGKTGSGKSLLLASILGESDILDGVVRVPVAPPLDERFDHLATKDNWIIDSAIACVAQVPWIENASIRNNILFGLPFDQERYNKVLFACALEKDMEMFPDGELTDIGANGVNLSGGQKWRISFARALYSRAGILVMDDIFSALDAHTGRHVHVHALAGELGRGRTRILVTHHVALCLAETDYSVHLQDGVVQHAGSVDELRRTGSLTEILADEGNTEVDQAEDIEEEIENAEQEDNSLQKVLSRRSDANDSHPAGESVAPMQNKKPRKFQQEEKRETGSIKLDNYKKYVQNAGGYWFWTFLFFWFGLFAVLAVGRTWWVNVWTRSNNSPTAEQHISILTHVVSKVDTQDQSGSLAYYLGIYIALSVATCVVGSLRYLVLLMGSIKASRNLFNKLTYTVLRAPLRWLDTVPVGRILNRFTADFNAIDSRLAYDFGFMLYQLLMVLGIIAAGLLVSPIMIVFACVLLSLCLYYSLHYLAGAREVKRLESNAKSPIFEQFGSALIGLGTIRAFGKAQTYVELMYTKIDRHAQAYWSLWLFNRWLGFRMNAVGAIFSIITAALVISIKDIDASLAGFALSFALKYATALAWVLRQYANVELNMNSTERVLEYSAIEIENQGGLDAPAAWPTEGRLEVSDLVVSYAPDLPPVLKGLSFVVEKNQRVGVVGRTGAGKSSLTLALFRFLEAQEGTIHIDGIDISKIKLHDLRSRLAIIPQDPVLFSGTVRSNLDPFNEFGDAELRDALERVHLISSTTDDDDTLTHHPSSSSSSSSTSQSAIDTDSTSPTVVTTTSSTTAASTAATTTSNVSNTNIFTNLSSSISEGGLNLSQGQRQLLCLARAIVSRPKIMVLDEATSAVDMATDTLIQRSIRSEFGRNETTLLVIAHRLSTIADFDRILVMDAGKAVEFGSPRDLMRIEDGVFRGLVRESGERETLERVILGDM